jgi:HEPN domain-containing protein
MNKEKKKLFVKNYLDSSKRRIKNSREALEEGDYSYVIRNCQEIVELCSKSLIMRWGFVVPEKHDIKKE